MANEPQLSMQRLRLEDLPPVALPDGYLVRNYQPGDDQHSTRIIAASFGQPEEHFGFDRIMRSDPAFHPERIFFIEHAGGPVATASAWYKPTLHLSAGEVHYVGVMPGHQGKALGYCVSLRALHRLAEEGRASAVLLTDDWRLPAVATYLKLGFVPWIRHESHPERWVNVFNKLRRPELSERFATVLKGDA